MIQKEEAGIVYFEFESFGGYGRSQHAIFSRQGGVSQPPHDSLNLSVSVPDEKTAVYANRARAFGLFGRQNDTVVHVHLVHGNDVARVTQANNGTWMEHFDAIITNEPGCALTMNFADCTPILLLDPVNHAIGLGHAGWKGTVVDLPGAMVRAMQQQFGSDPAELLAGIGPCISWENYEVDEPLVGEVQTAFAEWELLLRKPGGMGNGRFHYDLPEANRQRLLQAGVQQIEQSGLCTADRTDLFFSHRAEKGKTGRFGSIFVLLPKRGE
jgi:YfiH family protein